MSDFISFFIVTSIVIDLEYVFIVTYIVHSFVTEPGNPFHNMLRRIGLFIYYAVSIFNFSSFLPKILRHNSIRNPPN